MDRLHTLRTKISKDDEKCVVIADDQAVFQLTQNRVHYLDGSSEQSKRLPLSSSIPTFYHLLYHSSVVVQQPPPYIVICTPFVTFHTSTHTLLMVADSSFASARTYYTHTIAFETE